MCRVPCLNGLVTVNKYSIVQGSPIGKNLKTGRCERVGESVSLGFVLFIYPPLLGLIGGLLTHDPFGTNT